MIQVKCVGCSRGISETSKYCPYCGRRTTVEFRNRYTGGIISKEHHDKAQVLASVSNSILHAEKSLLNIPQNGSTTLYCINGGITQVLCKFGNTILLQRAYEKAYLHEKELKLSCPMGNGGTGFCVYESFEDAYKMLQLTKSLENKPTGIDNCICAICEHSMKKDNSPHADTYYYMKFTEMP